MAIKWKLVFLVYVTIVYGKSLNSKQSTKIPFEFDDVVPNKFGQRSFGGVWISGNEFTYTLSGSFVKYNVDTKETVTVLSKEFIDGKAWASPTFRFSPDLSKILVRYAQRSIFRHSTVSRFSVVVPGSDDPEFEIADGAELQTAFFAPSGQGLAYILENNIYYLKLDALGLPEVITSDGEPGVIYNGIPDWVYEEEVLGTDAASWFSPNGEKLAFIRFDDVNVREAVYNIYGDGTGDHLYPEEVHLRYPKAGTTNPTVALFLVNLQNSNKQELSVPTDKVTAEHILGTVFWINDQTLGAIWMNRRQNLGVFVSYDATTFERTEIMEINEPNGWIDVNTPKCDANDVCYFKNNFDNWPTLTSIDTRTKQVQYISSSGMNVVSLYGIQNGVFYQSTPSAYESFSRHVYSSNGCLTCTIMTPEGNLCTYASASFSKDSSHYAMTCNGPDPSFTKIFRTSGNEEISTWEENSSLRTDLLTYQETQKKFFHVPVGGGFNASVKMQIPAHIDLDATVSLVKYPMLLRTYAGPGSIQVQSNFGISFSTYQVTKKDIIYVEIDGRGTGYKGIDMMFSVNNQLGSYEMDDIIAVTKHLVDTYDFIDKSRVGIWGWSYGGYATAMTLAKDVDKVFKCGISVAPVTSWRFYDTIYTERYMGIDSNAVNYNTSDVSFPEHIKVIGEHEFFLIHGNADDNVHYQQSMVLARELEKADIMFEQLSYPDEAHGISGPQRHLYHSMQRFWDNCFKL